jgi:hypothetical protein
MKGKIMQQGIVTFYINVNPDEGLDVTQTIELFRAANKELIEATKDSDYQIAIVPTTKEACRVEKVDFDKPFPRALSLNQREIESIEKRTKEKERVRDINMKLKELELKRQEGFISKENDKEEEEDK